MQNLPKTENALVLRTNFADDTGWQTTCDAIRTPGDDGGLANVDCVSDPAFDGATVQQLVTIPRDDTDPVYLFVVDETTLTHPERPLLVVDLVDEPGRTFRVIPAQVASVENNLSLANMDFSEFAENVDPDGVFRGFVAE